MTEKLYRIKPLVWEYDIDSFHEFYRAVTPFCVYEINKNLDVTFAYLAGEWDKCIGSYNDAVEAKAAAESHYRERLMMCLEPISVTVTNDGVYLSVS